jgi:hypothetical protein
MMIRYRELKKKPAIFRSMTGLSLKGFGALLPAFYHAYEDDLDRRDAQRGHKRQRERGGGRQGKLKTLEDKMIFILFYLRHYPVQELQGWIFGMGQAQAWDWIHRLTPILNQALGYEKQLPARKQREIGVILAACEGLEFIIDGTERPVRRPKDKTRQKSQYSGKKKRHTVKNNVVSDKRTRKIKVLSETCEGKKHDKKLADEQEIPFPAGSMLWQDTGFQGYQPEHITTYQPTKKLKGKELTPEQKERNQAISKERIRVEHSIGGVKVFGIVHQIFRNMCEGFDDLVMETACGLHNLRCDFPMTA